MKELIRRLALRPFLTVELLAATFFVTLLNLASPLFVIQVLNRYVTFGFDGTLFTLTTGMLLAVVLLFGFRTARTRLALALSAREDERLERAVYESLARIKPMALEQVAKARAQEMLGRLQMVQNAFDGPSITGVMDAPFSFLYIVVTMLLSPALAGVGLAGMAMMMVVGKLSLAAARRPTRELQEETVAQRGHAMAALLGADAVRAWGGASFLRRVFGRHIERVTLLRRKLSGNRDAFQTATQVMMVLTSVGIYAVGAMQVVRGSLTVGALIGANILTSRAIGSVTRFVQTTTQMGKAGEALQEIGRFLQLPREDESGTALKEFSGRLEFKDVAMAFPGSTGPLFESLDLKLEPGSVLIVNGYNGSGKTTLARLLAGLLDPSRGEILADGVNLRQLSPAWWRRNIVYVPQEPAFLNATVRENILMANPDLDEAGLGRVVSEANLGRFLYSHPDGLEMALPDMGRNLPLGIRRRMALARGLATGGRLVVMDEPTEGLDAEGCHAVYTLLNRMAAEGRTMVVFSHDPNIVKGGTIRLDLSVKPVPQVEKAKARASAAQRQ